MAKEVLIKIAKDGSVEIEPIGFTGKACLDATRPFEEAFGGHGEREILPEMGQRQATVVAEAETQRSRA